MISDAELWIPVATDQDAAFIPHFQTFVFILVLEVVRLTVDLVAVLHWLVDHHRCGGEIS